VCLKFFFNLHTNILHRVDCVNWVFVSLRLKADGGVLKVYCFPNKFKKTNPFLSFFFLCGVQTANVKVFSLVDTGGFQLRFF